MLELVGLVKRSSGSSSSTWQQGWLSRRVQQTIEIVDPIYSRKGKAVKEVAKGTGYPIENRPHTTGQACRRLVYRSAAEARF